MELNIKLSCPTGPGPPLKYPKKKKHIISIQKLNFRSVSEIGDLKTMVEDTKKKKPWKESDLSWISDLYLKMLLEIVEADFYFHLLVENAVAKTKKRGKQEEKEKKNCFFH